MHHSQRFNKSTTLVFLGILFILSLSGHAQAIECSMKPAFNQKDSDGINGKTPVWSDKDVASLLFVESLNVNTDGTRRSYNVNDFWGKEIALNNLCNAMRDGCNGLSDELKKKRRIVTQNAFSKDWPKDQLEQSKISPKIIPFRNGKPCPSSDGFLVSSTALHKPNITDVCDIDNYIDSLTTPAIVLPGNPSTTIDSEFSSRNAKVGDLVVTLIPGATTPVYAVVGDTGPANKLGEGSIALNGKLLGKNSIPENLREIKGYSNSKGSSWVVPNAIVLIFPGTRDAANPFINTDRINEAAKNAFEAWGGIERLNSCAEAYTIGH